MKRFILHILSVGAAAVLPFCATPAVAQTDYSPPPSPAVAPDGLPAASASQAGTTWPVSFTDGTTSYTVFEPQCDSWDGHQLTARCAVAVQTPAMSQPTYGTFAFSAITLVDKSTRTAKLASLNFNSVDFPSAQDQAEDYLAAVTKHLPGQSPTVSLDHLENSMATPTPPKRDHLDNLAPDIIISSRPSVLLYIDGAPVWRPVAGTSLQRVINTRMLLLKDQSGKYYVHVYDGYVQAASLKGSWTAADSPPDGAATAEKLAQDSGQVDLMTGEPDPNTQKLPSLKSSPVPAVYVATTPTELIEFGGQPQYASIPNTDLLYAFNTSGNVFKDLSDQQNYLLISGRWYRSGSLDGPWHFVPGNKLPGDFANIPDTSPKENVKASVPGTQQAEEALIANSVPESTAVSISTPMTAPKFDGSVQLAPINGTALHYVVNSDTPIIEVDPNAWYACQDGVWYDASSSSGPWMVAPYVPPSIYTIPPDSPLHYLTYVQVYGTTPDQVYEGYTPGYMGTEVADDGTVVYGTGYDYPPWIGDDWYGPPITWGWGWGPCWTPWCGWGFDCGFGWGWGWGGVGFGCFPPNPWWCGWRNWHDHDGRDHGRGDHGWGDHGGHHDWGHTASADFYHHHDNFAANRMNGAQRDPNHSAFGHAYNSRTGQLAGGQRGNVHNVAGSVWNPGRQIASRPNNFSESHAFNSGYQGFHGYGATANSFTYPAHNMYSITPRSSYSSGTRWYSGQYHSFSSPGFGAYRNFQSGGWRGGNIVGPSIGRSSFSGGGGGSVHWGGGGGGGGFRSGGGGGWSGGSGGGRGGGHR